MEISADVVGHQPLRQNCVSTTSPESSTFSSKFEKTPSQKPLSSTSPSNAPQLVVDSATAYSNDMQLKRGLVAQRGMNNYKIVYSNAPKPIDKLYYLK